MKNATVENTRNFALIGHSGDGKTSLGEALLYRAGATHSLGKVEDGSSVLNFLPEEKDRHTASVSSSLYGFDWSDHHVTLADTPGDPNFIGDGQVDWQNRRHFFGAAALAMRRILVERARRRGRIKHGGGRQRVPLDDVAVEADEKFLDYVVLDEALCRMEKQDERMSQIVMLRFFAGLTIEDTAQALGISPMTVKREWACARAWLYDELNSDEE